MTIDELESAIDELRESVARLRLELAEQHRMLERDIGEHGRRLTQLDSDVSDLERRVK